jgi:hypothetical protein
MRTPYTALPLLLAGMPRYHTEYGCGMKGGVSMGKIKLHTKWIRLALCFGELVKKLQLRE